MSQKVWDVCSPASPPQSCVIIQRGQRRSDGLHLHFKRAGGPNGWIMRPVIIHHADAASVSLSTPLQSWPFHCAAVTELVYLHNQENDPENVPLVELGRTQWGRASGAAQPAEC